MKIVQVKYENGTDLEMQDDGPDEAESQLGVSVNNIFCSDVD